MAIADAGSDLAAFIGLPLIYWIISDFGRRTVDRVRRNPERIGTSRWSLSSRLVRSSRP
jgi:hypothetical protein